MKLKFWILLIALMSLGGFQSSLQAQENQHTLKVLTYNLRFGELASLQELGEYIKSHDSDIVALQEVDINTVRERAPHQNNRNFIAE